ncbi:MAG: GAF domain-containing protein [Candidatus Hydrogenedentes bacterium]|nr:GAF domain-containing protein [Candidatus Hydrogenedentota bacterium]
MTELSDSFAEDTLEPFELFARIAVDLSQARSLEAIADIVRHASRRLVGSDGATFVLKDRDMCYYLDEDAIAPLWKGRRFPMSACISGWVMTHKTPAVIEDIYADSRIPHHAYRPTFVKSLAMVPVRSAEPVAAIGNYWAKPYRVTPTQLRVLQALADSTSVAMENVRLYEELEDRVRARTAQLEVMNKELESFSYSVSHDLRAPLRSIDGFSELLLSDYGKKLDEAGKDYLHRVRGAASRMSGLIDDLLKLSHVSKREMNATRIDLSHMVRDILKALAYAHPDRRVDCAVQDGIIAYGDRNLIRIAFENLLNNAWKYTCKRETAAIEFGGSREGARARCFVRDNGAGFDSQRAERLFSPFQRLHTESEFPGTGIGLATVQRIMHRHGGTVRAEACIDGGATFYVTLPVPRDLS